jgi:hypothetical protein
MTYLPALYLYFIITIIILLLIQSPQCIVERRITAIKAIEEAEGESTRSWMQLVQSNFSSEQLETEALDYFQENLPNLSVVHIHNEKHDTLELKWNDYDTCIVGDLVNDRNLRASITSLQTVGNLQFPGNSGLSMFST